MADKALGAVIVAVPGTLVRATKNRDTPSDRLGAQAISFQVLKSNVGVVYIGKASMVRATGVGVEFQLPAPSSATSGPFASASIGLPTAPAGLNAADFFVDADNANDGVLVTITVQ
jgi:hypothetical protein